jgi:hypothetical protein
MAKSVFDVLLEKIQVHKTMAMEFMETAGPKDYAEYRDMCGAIRGLSLALREIQDLSRNYLEEDEDD